MFEKASPSQFAGDNSLEFLHTWDNRSGCSSSREGERRLPLATYKQKRDGNPALQTTQTEDEQPEDKPPKELKRLDLAKVSFHKGENRFTHSTDEYDNPALIVRRGQVFKLTVSFNRNYDPGHDTVLLQFTTGPSPMESKRSLNRVPVSDKLPSTAENKWGAKLVQASGTDMILEVLSPANAPIGRYKLYVETRTRNEGVEEKKFRGVAMEDDGVTEGSICLLFNAFCKDDACYMEDEEERNECVMNDAGILYQGSGHWPTRKAWNFGQFDDPCLRACLYLLDKAGLKPHARASPTLVTRCLSKMVNSNDEDGGVMVGMWASDVLDYADGTVPWEWSGSVKILTQFMSENEGGRYGVAQHKRVKYGQCWVFSGVATTLCRAIGIPTRSVTNFSSAHDTDGSITIDKFFDEEGEPFEGGRYNDSIWNYHVWNESWFKRPDLPAGHDGWQAHDATPQESSEGFMQCGPASLKAIKDGDVYLPYDTGFLFGEVNGDSVHWTVHKDGQTEAIKIKKENVGKRISTRAPGAGTRRKDLTLDYKYRDGSDEGRRAVRNAYSFGSKRSVQIYEITIDDKDKLNFVEEIPDKIQLGEDLEAKLIVHNPISDMRTVEVTSTTLLTYYTGRPTRARKTVKDKKALKPGETWAALIRMEADRYMPHMVADGSISVVVKAKVVETGEIHVIDDVIEFDKPEIDFHYPHEIKKGQPFELAMSFTNPLKMTLTNGKFSFEAAKGAKPRTWTENVCTVASRALCEIKVRVTAVWGKKIAFTANFHSTQMSGISGQVELEIIQ